MANVMKHVGKYGGKPCIVLFREVPNEPENCLIVQTAMLDERQHDDLMNVVQSLEAQGSNEINEVLNRRQFSDGTNMLSSLHYNRNIQKVPVSMVSLTPTPAQDIPLADVNAEIRKLASHQGLKTAPESQSSAPQPQASTSSPADNPSIAQGLLTQAQLMKEDAERMVAEADAKIQEAYSLDPSLNPGKTKKSKASA